MDTSSRLRSSLQPLWTDYDSHGECPSTAFGHSRSPAFAASSAILPRPLHPSAPGYDPVMRKHEKALLERLDQRRSILARGPDQTLSPLGHGASARSEPPGDDGFTPVQEGRRRTMVAETRSMLLSGMAYGQAGHVGTPVDRHPSLTLPAPEVAASTTTPPTAMGRRESQDIRSELRRLGPSYLGHGVSADCLVNAVALRRPSDTSSSDDGITKTDQARGQTIRCRVRPRAPGRKPFILQRTFEIDELRSTVPNESAIAAAPIPTDRRSRISAVSRRRSSVAFHRPGLPLAQENSGLNIHQNSPRGSDAVPIRKL